MVKVQIYYSADSFVNGVVDILTPHPVKVLPYSETNNSIMMNQGYVFAKSLNLPLSIEQCQNFFGRIFGDNTDATSKFMLIKFEIIRNGFLWTAFIDDIKEVAYYYYKFIDASRVNELAKICGESNIDAFAKNASNRTWTRFYSKTLEKYIIENVNTTSSNLKYIVGLAKFFKDIYEFKDRFNMRHINTNKLYASIILNRINHDVNPNVLLNGNLEKIIKFAESSTDFDKEVIGLIADITSNWGEGSESTNKSTFYVNTSPASDMQQLYNKYLNDYANQNLNQNLNQNANTYVPINNIENVPLIYANDNAYNANKAQPYNIPINYGNPYTGNQYISSPYVNGCAGGCCNGYCPVNY